MSVDQYMKYFTKLFGLPSPPKEFLPNEIYDMEKFQGLMITTAAKICEQASTSKKVGHCRTEMLTRFVVSGNSVIPFDVINETFVAFCQTVEEMLAKCHVTSKIRPMLKGIGINDEDPRHDDTSYEIYIIMETTRVDAKFFELLLE